MDQTQRPLGIMTKFNDYRGIEHRRLLIGYDRAKNNTSLLQFVNPPEPGIVTIDLPNEALDVIVPAHAVTELLDLTTETAKIFKGQYERREGPFAGMAVPAIA